jgi:tetratricopeptide (TPR) repeat protein
MQMLALSCFVCCFSPVFMLFLFSLSTMKHIIVLIVIAFCTPVFAQTGKPKTTTQNTELEIHKKVYATAVQIGDADVAVSSLYYIIAVEGKNSQYRDSLALLYFGLGSYELCEKVAAGIVTDFADSIKNGKRLPILEALALSQGALGKIKEAIGSFETLLAQTNEMYHAYRLAEMQYTYKRVGEALQTVLKAETLKNSMGGMVNIDMGENRRQAVKLEAAVQNLKGYILLEEFPAEKPAAIAAFKKALEIQPDFVLAKNNLGFAENPPTSPLPEGNK